MQLTKSSLPTALSIRSYKLGEVLVNETTHKESIILTTDEIIEHQLPTCLDELTQEHVDNIAKLPQKLIIFGTGQNHQFPEQHLYAPLLNLGYQFEFMHTQAACHTYNVLMSENRDCAWVLLLK